MKMEKESKARKFLLGKLTEEEQTKIEKTYFGDKKLFEEILIVENELIDAYAAGALSAEDQSRFESRLMLNPKQRQRVGFAKTLVSYASSQPLEELNSPESSWTSVFSRLVSNKPLLSFAFAAVLIFFAGGIWLILDKQNSQFDQTDELAVIQTPPQQIQIPEIPTETSDANLIVKENKPEISKSPGKSNQQIPPQIKPETVKKKETPAIFSFVLSPGLTRAAGTSQRFDIPVKTDLVKIELKFEQGNFASYHAALETIEGNQIWSSSRLKAKKGGNAVTVSIPAKLLKNSDYILALKGITKEGIYERVEDYTFTVNK